MDSKAFDELIKQVGITRLTRLSALKALLGGSALAITAATFATEDADARRGKKGRERKGRHGRRRVKGIQDTAPPTYKPTKPREEPTTEEPTTEAPLECDAYGNCPDEKCSTWECVEVKYDDGYDGYIIKGFCEYSPVVCEEKPCKIGFCDQKTGKCKYDQVICDFGFYCDPYAENYDPYSPTCVANTGGAA